MNNQAPLNYFLHAAGPAALPVMHLGWIFAGICSAVYIIIAILLCIAILHPRPKGQSGDVFHAGNGLKWVYIGTGLSICVLFGMGIYMLAVLNQTATPQQTPILTLTVTGYQWWWKAEYENDNPALRFTTANEIHIPVGMPVVVELKSADVIHSFWVPQLAGKTQMIPGLVNRQWIEADAPGVYYGQCTEFCGVQHAHMMLEIIAQSAADFQKWEHEQLESAHPSRTAKAVTGKKLFMDHCAACHTVRGIVDAGIYGPDLTHLQSRRLIAAGLLTNTPPHLSQWVAQAQELKPGARMPDTALTPSDTAVLMAFLATLK